MGEFKDCCPLPATQVATGCVSLRCGWPGAPLCSFITVLSGLLSCPLVLMLLERSHQSRREPQVCAPSPALGGFADARQREAPAAMGAGGTRVCVRPAALLGPAAGGGTSFGGWWVGAGLPCDTLSGDTLPRSRV